MNAGMYRFAADLADAADEVQEKARLVTAKAALDIAAGYATRVRAAGRVDTGFMMGSAGSPDFTNDGLTVEIGPTAEYAIYQDLGTSTGVVGIKALEKATDENAKKWLQAMEALGGDLL